MEGLFEAAFPFLRRFAAELILLTLALAIGTGSLLLYLNDADKGNGTLAAVQEDKRTERIQTVIVDVAGAIKKDGIYELPSGSRLKDAITAAGGLSDEADADYFRRNFNQARYLTDQEKIYVPTVEETAGGIFAERRQAPDYLSPQAAPATVSLPADAGTISINSAEAAELESLPGVGAATAAKIIQLRPYATIEELLTKKAVKKNIFDQIQNLISP